MKDKYAAQTKYRKVHPDRVRACNTKWKKANPEKVRAERINWKKANPEKVLIINRTKNSKWRKKHPDREHAHYIARRANISVTECLVCGSKQPPIHMHHPDYTKPLEVVILCNNRIDSCHFKEHEYEKEHGKLHSMLWWKQYAKKHNKTRGIFYGNCNQG